MLLCAGLGTRLRPLTDRLPKPLLPVGDRPALGHLVAELLRQGESVAVANSHWLGEELVTFANGLSFTLTLSNEPHLLGVAGGVSAARSQLEAPVAIWNGDILCERPPLAQLRRAADEVDDICLAVAPRDAAQQGTVGLGASGEVVRLRGETFGREVSGGDYVGLWGASASALQRLPSPGCLIGDYCLSRLRDGKSVRTLPYARRWYDIGSPRSYLEANLEWLARSGDSQASHLGPDARVGPGVELDRCVVGAGARVQGDGRLSRCVVWPGAVATAPQQDSIFATHCVVSTGGAAR